MCTGSQRRGNQCTAMGGMGTITILVFHRGQSAVDSNVALLVAVVTSQPLVVSALHVTIRS
jgi:hypothetical protein